MTATEQSQVCAACRTLVSRSKPVTRAAVMSPALYVSVPPHACFEGATSECFCCCATSECFCCCACYLWLGPISDRII